MLFGTKKKTVKKILPADLRGDYIYPAKELLDKYSSLVDLIKEHTATTPTMWTLFYLAPIERYADFVQLLPVSPAHHHASKCSLLENTLQIIAYSLKFRRGKNLPLHTSPEKVFESRDHWTWAVFAAALTHELGKVATDLSVEINDDGSAALGRWSPYYGPMTTVKKRHYYEYGLREERSDREPQRVSLLLLHYIFCNKSMDWLSRQEKVQRAFLATIAGDRKNPIGALIADAKTYLFPEVVEPPSSKPNKVTPELYEKKTGTYRDEVSPTATMVANQSEDTTIQKADKFAPQKNHAPIKAEKHRDRGLIFYAWLRQGLISGHIKCNGSGAAVNVVDWGLNGQAVLLCSPKIFKLCLGECEDTLQTVKWEHIQRGFVALGMCQLAKNDTVFHEFAIQSAKSTNGSEVKIKGYIVPNTSLFFSCAVASNPNLVQSA